MTYQADPKLQAKAQAETEERNKREQEVRLADMRWLMNDPRGRRHVHRLIAAAGLLTGADLFDTSATQMANNVGRDFVARQLLKDVLNNCPEQLLKMLDEAKNTKTRDTRNAGSRSKAN